MKPTGEEPENAVVGVGVIRRMTRQELASLVEEHCLRLSGDEAVAVLEHRYCDGTMCQTIAQNPRLSGQNKVRLRLVAHRATPQSDAVKFVHYLYWADLLRLSVDVRVPPVVRRAMEVQLARRVVKMALGEKTAAARRCGHDLLKILLFDPSPRVFTALLRNPRLREEDLLELIASERVAPDKLAVIASDERWGVRYEIRLALVRNRNTPRSIAASQLRHLRAVDRRELLESETTSLYLRRVIESRFRVAPGDQEQDEVHLIE